MFSGKRNIIFPDNARKIIFQRNFFGKTIFSGCLGKENVVFRAVGVCISFEVMKCLAEVGLHVHLQQALSIVLV